jgi:hypothetical protein
MKLELESQPLIPKRTIRIVDAHRDDEKRFIVRAKACPGQTRTPNGFERSVKLPSATTL